MRKYSQESQELIDTAFTDIEKRLREEFETTQNEWFRCLLARKTTIRMLAFCLFIIYDEITEDEQNVIYRETDKIRIKITQFAKKFPNKDSIVPDSEIKAIVSDLYDLKKFIP